MTESLEDYLETIYVISRDKKVTRVKEISERMGVKKPSVINALRELKIRNFISQEKYGYILLTGEGVREAQGILKKHRVLKKFLMDVVGVSERSAENDACKMEHVISGETMKKISMMVKSA